MTISVRNLGLPGVLEIVPQRFGDDRGLFCEVWNAREFAQHGLTSQFIQDNQSISVPRGVLRGLHYQLPPFAQDKLVRVVRGSVFDVAVDIRRGSPTFGLWTAAELSAEKWNQIFVPAGYAHGFVTLEPNTEVIYKVTQPYSRAHERAIRFDDPNLAITWPVDAADIVLSDKDRAAPLLETAELPVLEEEDA